MKHKRKWIGLLCAVLAALWLLWGNIALETSAYTLPFARLPEAFHGFRIAQVSDLHNARMGKGGGQLIRQLTEAEPDIIVITGDIVDSNRTDVNTALRFLEEAAAIAPCYYVTGNHEAWVQPENRRQLLEGMEALDVTVLRNQAVPLERDGQVLTLAGVDDPAFSGSLRPSLLGRLCGDGGFTVLLSHRPEYFDSYVQAGFDLVFTGHAHGGQFRLPWLGGLIAPDQGLFPTYDAGQFEQNGTRMLVSRGIGNSVIPLRIGNRPELVVAELRCE